MGIGTGIGSGIWLGGDNVVSWEKYWPKQSEVLFFGLYSEISGGQMPNKVTGATDFLTVAGVAGSETYQAPHNAIYEAADTDYIWFKTDGTQRTVTTAELIGYDLQRTPVKYDDNAPYAIVAIMILKSGATISGYKLNKLFNNMWLPIEWHNDTNGYGHVKGNRINQNLWTPEAVYPVLLDDGNTLALFDSTDFTTIIKDESNLVSQWNDKLGSGRNLLQSTGDYQPLLSAEGILFDGSDDYMETDVFTHIQPLVYYAVIKQVTWTVDDHLFGGGTSTTVSVRQYLSTPNIRIFGSSGITYVNLPVGTMSVLMILFNGSSSSIKVNNINEATGNLGAANPARFILGGMYNAPTHSNFSNISVREIIIRKIADSASDQTEIYNYLKDKYGL